MTRAHRQWLRFTVVAAGFLPALALAHPGHGDTANFVAGALHPLTDPGHMLWLVMVGVLAVLLGRRYLWPATAAFLGILIAAWTNESDGWQYLAGFLASSAGLIAAAMLAMTAATRFFRPEVTAAAPRSPTWAAGGVPAYRPCVRR